MKTNRNLVLSEKTKDKFYHIFIREKVKFLFQINTVLLDYNYPISLNEIEIIFHYHNLKEDLMCTVTVLFYNEPYSSLLIRNSNLLEIYLKTCSDSLCNYIHENWWMLL